MEGATGEGMGNVTAMLKTGEYRRPRAAELTMMREIGDGVRPASMAEPRRLGVLAMLGWVNVNDGWTSMSTLGKAMVRAANESASEEES